MIDNRLDEQKKKKNIKLFKERTALNRKTSFVNCWHINKSLNNVMREEYGVNSKESIVIETTSSRLEESFIDKRLPLVFEKIRYYEEPFFNQESYWFPSLFKTKKYEKEKEYRTAIYQANPYDKKFIKPKVDLNKLIESIHIHPKADKEFVKKINKIINNGGLNITIK
jgi:hypothetical protein